MGKEVKAGDILVVLDDTAAQYQLKQAQQTLLKAQYALAQASETIEPGSYTHLMPSPSPVFFIKIRQAVSPDTNITDVSHKV